MTFSFSAVAADFLNCSRCAAGKSFGNSRNGFKIAFFGALTGSAANLGVNIRNGAQLAVEQYNSKHADCTVELKQYEPALDTFSRVVLQQPGSPEAMFQQGDRSSIFLYSLPTHDILVVIFSDLSKTGLVKVQAEQTAKLLAEELIQMTHPGH